MSSFLSWLKRKIIRWTIYLVGAFVILAIFGSGMFYMAKPYLTEVAEKKLAAYQVKSDMFDLSLPGNVVLTNVTLPAPDGINVTAERLSVRPPIGPISGSATFNGLLVKYENITLDIPYLTASGISLGDKDMSTDSRVLQNLSRVGVSSLNIPDMKISLLLADGKTEKMSISGFSLSGLKKGMIGSIGLDAMNGSLSLGALTHKPELDAHINASSGVLNARAIDIAYGYALLTGRPTGNKSDAYIFGKVNLDKINIDIASSDNQKTSLKLGHLISNGLKMKKPAQAPEVLLKNIQAAKALGDKKLEEKAVKQFVMALVQAITSVDGEVTNVSIKSDKANVSLSSFRFEPKSWKDDFAIPQQMLISVKDLAFDSDNISSHTKEILDMTGLMNQTISGDMQYSYNQRGQTLMIDKMSFDIGGLASGDLSAKIVNVNEGFFSGDPETMSDAIGKLGISEIYMHYNDTGLIDHTFEAIGKEVQPNDVAGLKKELYDDLYLVLTQSSKSLLRDPNQAQRVADTLGTFAKSPKQLSINIKSKDKNGLTLNDLANSTGSEERDGLSLMLEKINLTVENR